VQILDAQSGRLRCTFSMNDCTPTRVYLAHVGSVLAALSVDGHTREATTLFAWDTRTGERVFFRESGSCSYEGFLACDPSGAFIVVPDGEPDESSGGRWRSYTAVYEVGTWRLRSELPKMDAATVLPSGEIAHGSRLGRRVGGELDEGARRADAACGWRLTEMVASRVAPLVARAGELAPILIESTTNGEAVLADVPRTAVRSIAFSADARRVLILCENDDVLRTYDAASGALVRIQSLVHTASSGQTLQALAGGCALELEHDASGARLWNWTDDASVVLADVERAQNAAFAPNGRWVAVVERKWISVYAVATGERRHRVKRPPDERLYVAAANDGSVVAWGGGDQTEAWIARDAGPRVPMSAHRILSSENAALSHDGRLLAIPSDGNELTVVEVANGRRLALGGAPRTATAIAFSESDRTMAAGTLEGAVVLFDLASGARAELVPGHDGVVTALAFSADGAVLATGGADATVLIVRTPALG
jgi:hypothetical protein